MMEEVRRRVRKRDTTSKGERELLRLRRGCEKAGGERRKEGVGVEMMEEVKETWREEETTSKEEEELWRLWRR